MNEVTQKSNPFSTRFTRPGGVPFVFTDDDTCQALIERLRCAKWRGQIVGPHGSGKSTLIESLLGPLEDAGKKPARFRLQVGQRRLPNGWKAEATRGKADVVVLDGYDQLWPWRKLALRAFVNRRGLGLIVTSHTGCRLPTVFRTSPDADVFQRVVHRLAPGTLQAGQLDLARAFDDARGNIREALFALYDQYEQHLVEQRA